MASKKKASWQTASVDWKFKCGDIVKLSHRGVIPECNEDGKVGLNPEGICLNNLSQTCIAVIKKKTAGHQCVFENFLEDGSSAAPDKNEPCYVVMVIPSKAIQPVGFLNQNLGLFFMCKESQLSQGATEKRIADFGLWDNKNGIFNNNKISELKNKVAEDNLKEKGSHKYAGDR